MKFNKLAKDLGLSVTELSEKASAILPNANGGTEVNEEQEKAIRALLKQPETAESIPATFDTTTAPTDESLANAALDGIITDYSYRLRGAAIANAWIEQRADGQGNATDNPVIQKKIQVVLMLRKLGIPHAAPQPVPAELLAAGTESGLSLPPLVQSALESAFPARMQRINSPLPTTTGREAPQLQGAN